MTSEDAPRAPRRALRWAGATAIAVGGGVAAALGLAALLTPAAADLAAVVRSATGETLVRTLGTAPLATGAVLGAPVLAAVLAALLVGAGRAAPRGPVRRADRSGSAAAAASAAPPSAAGAASDSALRLLALLQQEGRFVDFLEEELGGYPDDQIGAAVRAIHEGCRAALRDRLDLAPVLPAAEGATVTVERGFDPAAVRVTGNVRGEPPYQGVVRHPGWRTTGLKLPEQAVRDASILAPAEVEVL